MLGSTIPFSNIEWYKVNLADSNQEKGIQQHLFTEGGVWMAL